MVAKQIVRYPFFEALRCFPREIATVVGFLWLPAVSFYVFFVWMTSYLKDDVGMAYSDALEITTAAMGVSALGLALAATLSDRIGRKPLLISGSVAFLLLSYPLFGVLAGGDFVKTLAALCVCAVLQATLFGPIPTTLVEIFPTQARYTALSLGYYLSMAIFGGSAPLLATWLIKTTGDKLAPAYYLMGCAAIAAVVLLTVPESYKQELK